MYWHIPEWIKRRYPEAIWDIYMAGKTIFLTFDDGPVPEITESVLETLEKHNAKGTFFCLGRNVERHPEIFNKIITGGHSVGNHTYSHLKGWRNKNAAYYADIELAGIHINSLLFRPPYGQIRKSQATCLKEKYSIIMWDIMSHDYEQRISKEKSLKEVFRYTRDGSIIVFHDSVKASKKLTYILPRLIEYFSEKGFIFEKIDSNALQRTIRL